MKYIREEHIKAAYLQMMNKFAAGENTMLKPFVDSLIGVNNKERLWHILELDELEKEKASLSSIISGDLNHLNEAKKPLRFINKRDCIKNFIDENFSDFIDRIMIEDRLKLTFHLKCGLNLTEEAIVK